MSEEELKAENAKLRATLELCRRYVRNTHYGAIGWWNYRPAYELIREHIDPTLGTRTE